MRTAGVVSNGPAGPSSGALPTATGVGAPADRASGVTPRPRYSAVPTQADAMSNRPTHATM